MRIFLPYLFLVLSACGQGGGSSADSAKAVDPSQPSFVTPNSGVVTDPPVASDAGTYRQYGWISKDPNHNAWASSLYAPPACASLTIPGDFTVYADGSNGVGATVPPNYLQQGQNYDDLNGVVQTLPSQCVAVEFTPQCWLIYEFTPAPPSGAGQSL